MVRELSHETVRRASRRALALLGVCAVIAGCGQPADEALARPHVETNDLPPREIVLVPRIPELVTYPCGAQCHDEREPGPEPRELREFHTERQLRHGEGINWCDSCHTLDDPDHLHLNDGTPLGFDESHRLCGQCHGPQFRNWRDGLHGIRVGAWYGETRQKLCTACHDPHTPARITLESLPPPLRPSSAHRLEGEPTHGGDP